MVAKNNIIGPPVQRGATPSLSSKFTCGVLCVTGQANLRAGEQMRVVQDGNVLHRTTAASPANLITSSDTQAFASLAAYRAAYPGASPMSIELTGASPIDSEGYATAEVLALTSTVAQPIPGSVATAAAPHLPEGWLLLGPQDTPRALSGVATCSVAGLAGVVGTAQPGHLVQVRDGAWNVKATATADANGKWSASDVAGLCAQGGQNNVILEEATNGQRVATLTITANQPKN